MKITRNKGYYYLAHSIRLDGKVIHREKYLGKDIPKDIGQIRETFLRKCMEEGIFRKLDRIKENFSREWKKYPESIKKEILVDLSVSFIYNTNAIEGSTITLDETEEIIKRNYAPNKPLHDIKETLNHSKFFFNAINEKSRLTNDVLLRWHKELFYETKPDIAGKFRDFPIRVGKYRAPDWQDLKILMKEFIEWHDKNSEVLHPVELAVRLHFKFEKIHPFGDGNGRVGRLVIANMLKKNNYPLLIIEYKKRKSYYRALTKSGNDFVNWMVRSYVNAHKKFVV